MKIGFTGSRNGWTEKQQIACHDILYALLYIHGTELHHGDCVGSDHQAHKFILDTAIKIVIHPPIKVEFRAYCGRGVLVNQNNKIEWKQPKSYLARNRDIVEDTDVLVATPATDQEVGGTWYTINWARKLLRHIFIVMPDGSVQEENK